MGFTETYNEFKNKTNVFYPLSVRARETLARAGVANLDDLCAMGADKLLEIRNCGCITLQEIEKLMAKHGRFFGDEQMATKDVEPEVAHGQSLLDGFKPRDWLAGQAMAAIVLAIWQMGTSESEEEIAAAAYKQADAMIAERKKHPECRPKWDDKNPRSTT